MNWKAAISALIDGRDLEPVVAAEAIGTVLRGEATDAQIGAFLVGMASKGVTGSEISAMVDALMAVAAPLELPNSDATVDIVGTGGSPMRQDRAFNISTISCFVVAAAGVPVCKHGNRRASSSSGSTDVLEALGINVELDGPGVARCVRQAGIGFAFARSFHPAMRHAGPVRAELGVPTVFNILGPLSHPGGVRRQVIGVADPALGPVVAAALAMRGSPRAMVVHGCDGLDELTLSGPSTIWEVCDGDVTVREFHPAEAGLTQTPVSELGVGAPDANAEVAHEILGGSGGARRDLVCLNAAAGLVVAGAVNNLGDGVELARESIDSGAAASTLDRLLTVSNAQP